MNGIIIRPWAHSSMTSDVRHGAGVGRLDPRAEKMKDPGKEVAPVYAFKSCLGRVASSVWGILLCLCFCGYACHFAPNDIVNGGVAKRTNTK